MIEKLKQLFSQSTATEDPEQQETAIRVACLVMMLETAKADHRLDAEERDAIETYARNEYQLDDETLKVLLAKADASAANATSLYEFTSLINEHFSEPQKFRVVKSMWDVAYADGRIDRYEEHIIRRAADLLYVEHHRFIEAKLASKEQSGAS